MVTWSFGLTLYGFNGCLWQIITSLDGEWQAQDALKKDYTIVFKKDKVKIGEQDYNYTVDGPKSKDAFTYYSLKVKDQGKETSYTVFFPTKSKEVALFSRTK